MNIFYNDYAEKPKAISAFLDSALNINKPIIKLIAKQKQGC